MNIRPFLLCLSLLTGCGVAVPSNTQPFGPEAGGLRLRLQITPRPDATNEQYQVLAELTNATHDSIPLQAQQWRSRSHQGSFLEFIEAAISIESEPPIEPWLGQVMAGRSADTPEPEHTLKPGETLSVTWTTTGRSLKNKVTNPLDVQNPEFRENGLHSVHARLILTAGGRPVQLRSNEQLVPFGRSNQSPKHTYGPIWWADEPSQTATLGLGSLHKIATGDRFLIRSGTIGMTWTLSITNVQTASSTGTLEPSRVNPTPTFPARGSYAALIHN